MVAKTITLPNLRKLFRPDPGFIICEADLAGADAQVVAWEANDEALKSSFRSGLKVHAVNALDLWGPEVAGEDGKKEPTYTETKRAVHATNYGAIAPTVAATNRWPLSKAEAFQERWFDLHPPIKEWHDIMREKIITERCVTNAFGFRRYYFDRIDNQSALNEIWKQALAWVPQSTVALAINKGLVRLHRELFPTVQPLLQVHDSVVFQVPKRSAKELMPQIKALLTVEIPYPDPLTIPIGIKSSAISWGDCK